MSKRHEYRNVAPTILAAYLSRNGWHRVKSDDLVVLWNRQGNAILAPVTTVLDDYEEVLHTAVMRLASALGRRPDLVLQDLLAVVYDIVELQGIVGLDNLGNLPLHSAADAVQSLHRLSLGAAYATWSKEPRAVVPPRRPSIVIEFVSSLKFGRIENGNTAYALFAPIPIAEQPMLWDAKIEPPEVGEKYLPFERKVTAQLPQFVSAAVHAAYQAHETGSMESFAEAVQNGVTVPLLRAIQQFLRIVPDDRPHLEMVYSPMFGATSQGGHIALPSRAAAEVLDDAIRFLEEREPYEIDEIEGPVVYLERKADEALGAISIVAVLNRRPQHVFVRLDNERYETSILAHKARVNVRLRGRLRREGRRLWLDDPSGFETVTDDRLETEGADDDLLS